MSGIIAWLRLDGAPADDATFRRLMQGSSYHGPDRTGTWSSGSVALGHHQLCTTPESLHELQPTAAADGSVRVAFDGRLDNRNDLLHDFSLRASEQVTDVDLLIRAYERWGIDCVSHLIGDYGFALWDARERRLLCARDPLGVRPVFYAYHAGTLAVASGLRELAASGCVPLDINEGMVGEYLTSNLSSVHETLYRYAFRLPPGHLMTVDARGLQLTRYWKPEEIAELSVSGVEAAQRFKALFFEAVRCRARSPGAIAAHLSGGLDSSSIVSVLGTLQANAELTRPFEAFTLTFPGMRCDETEYAELVATRYGHPWYRVPPAPSPARDYEALATRYLDFPGYPNGTFAQPLLERVKERQHRVVLTGMGGDDWLAPASPAARALDLVPLGQWSALKRELAGFRWPRVAGATARHLLARAFDRLDVHTPRHVVFRRRLPPWLSPAFVRRSHLVERISKLPPIPRGWSWSRAQRLSAAEAGVRLHPIETEHRMYSERHVELRHPFYDVRVVEFLLALPDEHCASQKVYKLVLREAMRDVLPERIRTRQSKAAFSHVFRESLGTTPVRHAFSRMGAAGFPDWIDGTKARAALGEFLGGAPSGHQWPLWCTYGVHLWWQALGARQADTEATAGVATPSSGLPRQQHGVRC
ncbi:MAG TPA: asparagine synthase-related protein [Polyangiaceae bacterium]|nr:asparagine synthase-related protein [Polyangiaceae bacterium]